MNNSNYIKLEEAATYLELTVSYVRKLVSQNKIPYIKQGKYIVFNKEILSLWKLERMSFSTSIEARQSVSNFWVNDDLYFYSTEDDCIHNYDPVGQIVKEKNRWKIYILNNV